jgi:sulfide:quinone oxidoreductase
MTTTPEPGRGSRRFKSSRRPHVLIAGAGVAGLETLLALRALAGDRVDITVVAPELKFFNRSMSADEPFEPQRGRGIRLADVFAEFDARWVRAELDAVMPEQRVAVTRKSERIPYDSLVLAVGARPDQWLSRSLSYRNASHALSYYGGRDSPDFRLLLARIDEGRIDRVAFVRPAGPSWPLPLYDLSLMTAAHCAAHGRPDVELSLITPEEEPLGIFGSRASMGIRQLLDEGGVALHAASYTKQAGPGWLDVCPGRRAIRVDQVVTEPRLAGPRLRGLPCDADGFIYADAHGRVPHLDGVFAAGGAMNFPVKQGGLAAQQADAVAETIAAAAGIDIEPEPFHPVLRGVLLTGAAPRYLRADISGTAGDDSTISRRALWWPPNKLAGRYLAPYLSSRLGEAMDVMPQDPSGIPVETTLDHHWPVLADLPASAPD